jgi:hypothetical protein
MATMVVELYAALKSAGAPDDQATAAARVVADRDAADETKRDMAQINTKLTGIEVRMAGIEGRMTGLEGQMQGLKWMQGFVMAGITALIVRTFFGP